MRLAHLRLFLNSSRNVGTWSNMPQNPEDGRDPAAPARPVVVSRLTGVT
jgi:hypothetical protein